MTEGKHTPTPWRYWNDAITGSLKIGSDDSEAILDNDGLVANVLKRSGAGNANSSFIVRACNNHEGLLMALRGLMRRLDAGSNVPGDVLNPRCDLEYAAAADAIAKAEGGKDV